MLEEFEICGFRVFWKRTIMETDWGILYYALFSVLCNQRSWRQAKRMFIIYFPCIDLDIWGDL